MESRLEKIFSMGINSMSLAVWLGEDWKFSAAVVGLDLLLGLSMVRRCSLNRSFKRRFRLSYVLYITAVTLNHVDEVFSFTSEVRFYGASFPGREEGIRSKSVRNVGTSSTVFASTERTRRKLGIGRIKREFSCNW